MKTKRHVKRTLFVFKKNYDTKAKTTATSDPTNTTVTMGTSGIMFH